MTLKDKFEQWFINDEEDEHYEGMVEQVAIAHEKIADEYAIEFTDWCENTYYPSSVKGTWFDHFDFDNATKFSTKQLLQIYKQTL